MEAKEKIILSEVISGMKLQFYIPVYQRNYSWNEKNCERLFNDILELVDDKNKTHFIGSLVYKLNKFVETQYNQFVLIDGQQRLTSLTLILKALHDYLGSFGDEYEDLMIEIKEGYLFNKFAKDEKLRLKLKPNKEDDVNFNCLMANDFENIKMDSLIYLNYKYFLNRIKSMPCSTDDFYNALQRIEGVSITLDSRDNPQLIFESLNSTGMDLDDVDLIRNYLLMNCLGEEQERLYNEYWVKLEAKLGSNFTEFVRDYLSLKNGNVTPNGKNKVYSAFRKYYEKERFEIEEFLKKLRDYSDAYSLLVSQSIIECEKGMIKKGQELKLVLNDIIKLNIRTTFPFLLGILNDYKIQKLSEEETIRIIRLIESYSVRRSICGVQGGALSMTIASLYKELIEKDDVAFYNSPYLMVATKLASINSNGYFPKDEQFKDEFTRKDMYNSKLKKYILDKLECNGQSKELVNTDNLTIEHIMPFTLSDEWKKYLNMENVDEFHEQYKNRIGNLTLTAYNSEMSQKLFIEKKKHIDFSRLYLNKYFEQIIVWDKKQIEVRGEELFKIAKKLWPFPNVVSEFSFSSESYDILSSEEDVIFTNTKPIKFIFDGEEIYCNDWTYIYTNVLKYLYSLKTDNFINLVLTEDFGGGAGVLFNSSSEKMRNDFIISDGLYCELNLNTMRKIKVLRRLFERLELDERIIVYIVPA